MSALNDTVVDDFENGFTDRRIVERLPVSQLYVDSTVQRDLSPEKVQKRANEWDWAIAEIITVVQTSPHRYRVTEGQARTEAIRLRNPMADTWCIVLPNTYSAPELEATVADAIQATHRGHTPLEKWNLRLVRGCEHESAAESVLLKYGLRLGTSPSSQTIVAVESIRAMIYKGRNTPEMGAELLERVLWVLLTAYPDHDGSSRTSRFHRHLLTAISEVIRRNDDVDLGRLAKNLQTRMAIRWINDITIREGNLMQSIANSIMNEYNHKKQKGRLAW